MPDIFNYGPEPNPNDIKASDPTVLRVAGGAITADLTAAEAADTLSATVALEVQASLTAQEQADALTSTTALAVQASLTATENADTLSSLATIAIQAGEATTEAADTLEGLASLGPIPILNVGDDVARMRAKKPLVTIRPKIERDLDDVIETLEAIPESDRPPAKREAIRAARAILKAVEAPEAYRAKLVAIDSSLARAARAAAVHQGITAALASAAAELQSLTEELERKRLQRRRNEAIVWLLAA